MGYIKDGAIKWLTKLVGNNGIQVMDDGSLRKVGSAIVYDDIIGDVMSKKLYVNTGKVDYNWSENYLRFQRNGDITSVNDRIQFNVQLPHKATIGVNSFMKWHIHWFQEDTVQRELTFEYRLQNNGAEKQEGWSKMQLKTNDGDDLFPYTTGTISQITTFKSPIDILSANISSTLQVRVAREDSNSGNLNVTFLDAHVSIDSDGSRTEWVK